MAPKMGARKTAIIILLIILMALPRSEQLEFEFLSNSGADDPQPLGFTAYHSFNETVAELNQIASDHPGITKLISIGKSYEGRDIWAMKVSDNPEIGEDEPEVYYNGNHHAREWLTIELCLYILNYLTDNYGVNTTITDIVDNRQIWVIPCVNPDGRVFDSPEDDPTDHTYQPYGWRKNRVDNGDGTYGVDLNRNYDYMWGGAGASDASYSGTYRGPEPFSENETRAIRDFVQQHDFVFSISYHTSGQLILYPWGYTYNESEDDDLLHAVAVEMANLITNKAGSAYPGYTPAQGSDLYMTSGTDDDWLYGEMGIFAYCIELYPDNRDDDAAVSTPYDSFHPISDKVVPVCQDNIEAALFLAKIADNPFQVFDYHVSLSAPVTLKLINQTETDTFTITVTNDGSNNDVIELTASGIPGWTIDLNPTELPLSSETSDTTTITITVPDGTSGGIYKIWVNATSQSNSSISDSLIVSVQVPYFDDVGIYSIDTFTDKGTYIVGDYFIDTTTKNFGKNPQNEYNVSLEIRKLGSLFTQTVYYDDMENGTDGWQVVDLDGSISSGSWKQVTSTYNSGTTSWWCGDTTTYTNKTVQMLLSPTFNLKWAEGANLTFYHKYKTENNYDYCGVDLYNGTAWKLLASYDGNGPSSFQQVTISLKDFVGNDKLRVRFIFTSDEALIDSGWYIDDVEVTGEFPEETTIFGPELKSTLGIMPQDATLQLTWNYKFIETGTYKIYATTLLETDEQQNNNQSVIKITMILPPNNFTILKQGWNLISIPKIQVNQDLIKVLEGIEGYYDAIQWYDPTDTKDPWKHNKVGKPFVNDLFKINETMSFWVHIAKPGDTIFLYNGTQPISNQTIQLYPGWNMVGYPSLTSYNRTDGLNNLIFGQDVDKIQWYDAKNKLWYEMEESDYFMMGRGYWVHSVGEYTLEVPL